MNEGPLDELYFEWLAVQVVNTRLRARTQTNWNVLRKLYSTEFLWRIRNDDNRVADGLELRSEFLEERVDLEVDPVWFTQGCSFLEMLIALSRRLTFETEGVSSAEWFWQMLDNVGLHVSDRDFESQRMEIFTDQVLQALNNRTYNPNGRGGLFPLNDAQVDQTQVEIWYQMNYYLLERS
jgi:hypothetical protein